MPFGLDIVGFAEIAALTGVKKNTLQVWRLRGYLPAPDATLTCGLVWRRARIVEWMAGAGAERLERNRRAGVARGS